MARRKIPEGQCEVLIQMPKALRAELEKIRAESGLTMGQQVRHSLNLWVKRMTGKPLDAGAAVAGGMLPANKLKAWETPDYDPSGEPEPDIETDPAAWASWSAKQGDWAVKQIAKGKFKQ